MGRRIVAKREHGTLSGGRGVGALAISGNAPLFAKTCLGSNRLGVGAWLLVLVLLPPRCPFTGCVNAANETVVTCMKNAKELADEKCQSILGAPLVEWS